MAFLPFPPFPLAAIRIHESDYSPLLCTLVGSRAGCLMWSPTALGVCAFTVTNDPTPAVTDTQPTLDSTTSAALVPQPIPLMVKSCEPSGGKVSMRSFPPTGICKKGEDGDQVETKHLTTSETVLGAKKQTNKQTIYLVLNSLIMGRITSRLLHLKKETVHTLAIFDVKNATL